MMASLGKALILYTFYIKSGTGKADELSKNSMDAINSLHQIHLNKI
jgi:hypothetical protein